MKTNFAPLGMFPGGVLYICEYLAAGYAETVQGKEEYTLTICLLKELKKAGIQLQADEVAQLIEQ